MQQYRILIVGDEAENDIRRSSGGRIRKRHMRHGDFIIHIKDNPCEEQKSLLSDAPLKGSLAFNINGPLPGAPRRTKFPQTANRF